MTIYKPPNDMYNMPKSYQNYNSPMPTAATTAVTAPTDFLNTPNFDIPLNKFPRSESSSSSSSWSGMNWNTPFGKSVLGPLMSSIGQLPGLAKALPGTLQGMYSNLMRGSMGPEAFQGTLNSLANRGVLGSSVAENAMGSAASGIASNVGQRGYESFLQGLQAQMNVPSMLAQIAQLARESRSSGTSSASSSNPLAPYELFAKLLLG